LYWLALRAAFAANTGILPVFPRSAVEGKNCGIAI
jgi:hypothetical protein